jgi:hypothetical protein
MQRTRFVFGITVLFLAAGIVVIAQGRGTAPKPTSSTPKTSPAPHATPAPAKQVPHSQPKMTTKAAPVTKPASATKPVQPSKAVTPAKGPVKMDKTAPAKTAKAEKPAPAKTAKAGKPADGKLAKADTKKTSTTPTTATTTGTTPGTLTAVQEKLLKNTNLKAKLAANLPKDTDVLTAAAGFRNLGQFVAAVNVSNNLGLSFTQLKTKMVTEGMSLGQAIQAVRPLTASPTIEAQRAEYDARGMISESEQEMQATAATTKTPATTKTGVTTKTGATTKTATTTKTPTTVKANAVTTSTTAKAKTKKSVQ